MVPTESSFNSIKPGMIQIEEEQPKTKSSFKTDAVLIAQGIHQVFLVCSIFPHQPRSFAQFCV